MLGKRRGDESLPAQPCKRPRTDGSFNGHVVSDEDAERGLVGSWVTSRTGLCMAMLNKMFDDCETQTLPILRSAQRDTLVQTGAELWDRWFSIVVDPTVAARLPEASYTNGYPKSLLRFAGGGGTFFDDVNACWRRYETRAESDDVFRQCSHPWSREAALRPLLKILMRSLSGLCVDWDSLSDAWSYPAEDRVAGLIETIFGMYEAQVLVPLTQRRVQMYMPCKDLAGLATSYAVDAGYNAARRRWAAEMLTNSTKMRIFVQSHQFDDVGDIDKMELAIQRLDEWLAGLRHAWDSTDLNATAARPVDPVNRVDVAKEILNRWLERRDEANETLRLLAVGTTLPAEVTWEQILDWRYRRPYPFMFLTAFKQGMLRLLAGGHWKEMLVVLDIDKTLIDSDLSDDKYDFREMECAEAGKVIEHLHTRGHKLAIASHHPEALRVVNDLCWSPYFECVISTNNGWLASTKPTIAKSKLFHTIQQQTHIPFNQWVFFGALAENIHEARALGIRAHQILSVNGITMHHIQAAGL